MARCILHIGTPKTGTSAIHWSLWRNRRTLAEQGVFISDVLRPGYGKLGRYALDDDVAFSGRREEGETTPEAIAAWRSAVEAELDRLAETAGSGLTVLSDECLSDVSGRSAVARLRDALTARFDSVRVLVYLRPQHEREVSGFSQRLRNGDVPDAILSPAQGWERARLDYAEMLARWSDAFGDGAVTPRIYQNRDLVAGDAAADFAAAVGYDVSRLEPVGRQNESLTPEGQRLLRWLNRILPEYLEDGSRNPVRRAMVPAVSRAFPGKGLLPAQNAAIAFYRDFAGSNEEVRRRWFPDRAALFEVDFSDYPRRDPDLDIGEAELQTAMGRLAGAMAEPLEAHLRSRAAEIARAEIQRRVEKRLEKHRHREARLRARIARLEKRLERQSP